MFETLSQYGLSDIHLVHDDACGLQAIIAIHDTSLGPAIGGCRYPHYHSEQAAIEDVASGSDKDLRSGLNHLKKDALKRRIPVNEMQKPTITLSNFGTIAGRYANRVIFLPTVAILAAGVIRDEVCAVTSKAKVLPVMPLSLNFDHRLITGGEAARFMAALKRQS